jgi:hypothetical protein
LYEHRVVLERGMLRASHLDNYIIDVRHLEIAADTPGAEAVIRIKKDTVEVASLGGAVKVSQGETMLARVAAGAKASFQSGASADQKQPLSQTTTGAAPAPRGPSDKKTFYWIIGVTAAAALAIGLTAAAQGKSPF